LVFDLRPAALTTAKKINKLIIIVQDAVRCYSERYEEKKKQTVQTKLSMFIKKASPTSTQEHDPDMYCTVSLSKDKNITVFKMKNKR
jgi:hypothetical protein